MRSAMRHPDNPGAGAARRRKLGLTGREKTSVVMKEFYAGKLRSRSGELVTDVQQAKAIAMSEGRAAEDRERYYRSGRPSSRKPSGRVPRNPRRTTMTDESKVEALVLFADNTGELYDEKKRIIAKAAAWMAAGKYDASRAPKLWIAWIDRAAKMYGREFPDEPHNFSRAERLAAARQVADHEAGRIKRGEHGATPMAHAKTHKSKARRPRRAAPHQKAYKPKAHHSPVTHSTAHLPGPKAHAVRKPKRRHPKRFKTVSDTHKVPVAPSAATAVKALHGAIDQLEKVETELLTVRQALRIVRPAKPKKRHHPKAKAKAKPTVKPYQSRRRF